MNRLHVAIDANFRMKNKDRGVKTDHTLGQGIAYMVENTAYKAELANHHDDIIPVSPNLPIQCYGLLNAPVQVSDCTSSLNAVERANSRANEGYLATGQAAVVCARTSMVRGNGVGDLQKGER
jgi:hypothetical protein